MNTWTAVQALVPNDFFVNSFHQLPDQTYTLDTRLRCMVKAKGLVVVQLETCQMEREMALVLHM